MTRPRECRDCQKLQDLIVEFLDGEAGQEISSRLMMHIVDCRECTALLHSLNRVVRLCRADPGCDVPSHVHEQLWSFLQTRLLSRRRSRRKA
ncbi:MAG: zf-HC2 domain-containing protein [candidate division WOR-3 bacterium]